MAHFPRRSAGGQCEKNLGVLSSNIHKIMYGHKKKNRKKKYTRKKKNTAVHQKEWVSAEKKYSRKKKYRCPAKGVSEWL